MWIFFPSEQPALPASAQPAAANRDVGYQEVSKVTNSALNRGHMILRTS